MCVRADPTGPADRSLRTTAARLAAQRTRPLPRRRTRRTSSPSRRPGAGKTAFALRVAAELLRRPGDRRDHRGHAHRAPQAPVGGGRGRGVGIALDPDFRNSTGAHLVGLHRHRRHLRRRGRPPAAAPRPHREPAHAGDPRRGAPRGRRPLAGATRSRRPSTAATRRLTLTGTPFRSDDNPIPFVDYLPGRRRRACAAAPTTPTATPRRWPTAWCGRWCSSPTRARRAGAPARARRSPRGSASR